MHTRIACRWFWRNRKLIPLLIITITIVMVLVLGVQKKQSFRNSLGFVSDMNGLKHPSHMSDNLVPHHLKPVVQGWEAIQQQQKEQQQPVDAIFHNQMIDTIQEAREKLDDVPKTYNITPAPIPDALSFKPAHQKTIYRSKDVMPEKFKEWSQTKVTGCEGRFHAFDNNFALLEEVVLDRKFATGKGGGEDIMAVINQPEENEYYQYTSGVFQLPCKERTAYYFNGENTPLNEWLLNLKTRSVKLKDKVDLYNDKLVIALTRFEYVNLYHTMTDFYNAFIMMEYFNYTQANTEILFMDGHPKGGLDLTWQALFSSANRVGSLFRRTRFRSLVWATLGYESLLQQHDTVEPPPLIKEFRSFFLHSFHIKDKHRLKCNRPKIVLVWRHDYVAHPRNPSGHITRKIANEKELVLNLKQNFPTASVLGVQIDLFDMQQQLKMISETDILIGMHGAGLSHALFLPSHAAVLEFLPAYWSPANVHFEAFSRWSNLLYLRWINEDPENEKDEHFTYIPLATAAAMVRELLSKMCPPVQTDAVTEKPLRKFRKRSGKGKNMFQNKTLSKIKV